MYLKSLLALSTAVSALCCGAIDFVCAYRMGSEDYERAWATWPIPVDADSAKKVCDAYITNILDTVEHDGVSFKPTSGPSAGKVVYPVERSYLRHAFKDVTPVVTNTAAGAIVCGWVVDVEITRHVVVTDAKAPYAVTERDETDPHVSRMAVAAGHPYVSMCGHHVDSWEGNVTPEQSLFIMSGLVRRVATHGMLFRSDADWAHFYTTITAPDYRTKAIAADARTCNAN